MGTIRVAVFKLFPILLTILLVWGLCAVLTATEAIAPTNAARWVEGGGEEVVRRWPNCWGVG